MQAPFDVVFRQKFKVLKIGQEFRKPDIHLSSGDIYNRLQK